MSVLRFALTTLLLAVARAELYTDFSQLTQTSYDYIVIGGEYHFGTPSIHSLK